MIPWSDDFEQPQARFMFGLNKLVLEWQQGSPLPSDLAKRIADHVSQRVAKRGSHRVTEHVA